MFSRQLHKFEIFATWKFKIFHHYDQECIYNEVFNPANLLYYWSYAPNFYLTNQNPPQLEQQKPVVSLLIFLLT